MKAFIDKYLDFVIKQKLSTLLPQHDKLKHFFCGFFIFQVTLLVTSEIIALLIACLVAVLKELYDKFIKETYIDLVDIAFTVLPAIILIL